jgi:citrate synthase
VATLKDKLREKIPAWRERAAGLVKDHGEKAISGVTLQQAYGGMRGVKALVCDTSLVDPETGLIIRGIPLKDLTKKLPEEIFYLLCTGELPDAAGLKALQDEMRAKAKVPDYVWKVLDAMPADSHPMVLLDAGILCMQRESVFKAKYDEGVAKSEYWESTLDDAITLLARLPAIAAYLYRLRFKKGARIDPDPKLDWGGNYAHMLGVSKDPEFANFIRLYLVLHCDHEGGNVSAFTCRTVNSALSDLYYSASAGLNGLAGPLHGLANQECLGFVLGILEQHGGKVPSDEDLKKFVWDTLNSGRVVPGYGHAVLRATDPRFSAFIEFGKRVCPDDPAFKLVERLFNVVPKILMEHGKAKNPWPNVDAGSGSLLYHFGLKEFPYYTVPFGVSRAMGLCSQAVEARAMMTPITRPKSIVTGWLEKEVGK